MLNEIEIPVFNFRFFSCITVNVWRLVQVNVVSNVRNYKKMGRFGLLKRLLKKSSAVLISLESFRRKLLLIFREI